MLQKLDSDVRKQIDDLEGFKFVLTVISTIIRMSVTAELTCRELQERYHVLSEHKVPVKFFFVLKLRHGQFDACSEETCIFQM
jgi:hypothetical protein